jgi:hypothetical protein
MRPKVMPGTPSTYKELMEQCWDADPTKRPDIMTLWSKFIDLRKLSYQSEEQQINNDTNIYNSLFDASSNISSSSPINSFFNSSSSRVYNFKNFKNLLPRNATKGKYC